MIGALGATVSTVKLTTPVPTLPPASVARTVTLCGPSSSEPVVKSVGPQATNAPPSTEHSIVTALSSVTVNSIVGVESLRKSPLPGAVMFTLGTVPSIVSVTAADSTLSLPASSVAVAVKS